LTPRQLSCSSAGVCSSSEKSAGQKGCDRRLGVVEGGVVVILLLLFLAFNLEVTAEG
jgi:hypothetical protein